jgi:hypothetical protein
MARLLIDLRTDYLPGVDFAWVAVTAYMWSDPSHNHVQVTPVSTAADTRGGVRIAEFPHVQEGSHHVLVKLVDDRGRGVDMRSTRVDLRGDHDFVQVISRR